MTKLRPHEIELKSMEIISEKVDLKGFKNTEIPIVKRIIHTTGDLEIHQDVQLSDTAVQDGLTALQRGADIYTDVRMVVAGLNKKHLARLGSKIHCRIDDPTIAEQAKASGRTRSETAMESFGENLNGQIVAIGNAPTALFKLLELHRDHGITPALIIGVPVGFVGAKESKDALMNASLSYITVSGYKGGSPVAATTVNALLKLL